MTSVSIGIRARKLLQSNPKRGSPAAREGDKRVSKLSLANASLVMAHGPIGSKPPPPGQRLRRCTGKYGRRHRLLMSPGRRGRRRRALASRHSRAGRSVLARAGRAKSGRCGHCHAGDGAS